MAPCEGFNGKSLSSLIRLCLSFVNIACCRYSRQEVTGYSSCGKSGVGNALPLLRSRKARCGPSPAVASRISGWQVVVPTLWSTSGKMLAKKNWKRLMLPKPLKWACSRNSLMPYRSFIFSVIMFPAAYAFLQCSHPTQLCPSIRKTNF